MRVGLLFVMIAFLALSFQGSVRASTLPYTDSLFYFGYSNYYNIPPANWAFSYQGYGPNYYTGATDHEAWGYVCPNCNAGVQVQFSDVFYYTGPSTAGTVSTKWTLSARMGATPAPWFISNAEAGITMWLKVSDQNGPDVYQIQVYSDSCGYACYKSYDNQVGYGSLSVYWIQYHAYTYQFIVLVDMWAWGGASASIRTWYTINYIKLQ